MADDFMSRHWAAVDRKYDILAEQARAATTHAQTEASTLPGLRAAQGDYYRGMSQHALETAREIAEGRNASPDFMRGLFREMVRQGYMPPPGQGAPGADAAPPSGAPAAPAAPGSTTEAGPRPATPWATPPWATPSSPDATTPPAAKKMSYDGSSAAPAAQNISFTGTDDELTEGGEYKPLGVSQQSLADTTANTGADKQKSDRAR